VSQTRCSVTQTWRDCASIRRCFPLFTRTSMRCLVCGGDMFAVTVEPDHRVGMDSFQYRTFRCGSCGDTERHFAFDP
jgi:hypothetical protein